MHEHFPHVIDMSGVILILNKVFPHLKMHFFFYHFLYLLTLTTVSLTS